MALTLGEAMKVQRLLAVIPEPTDPDAAAAALDLADLAFKRIAAGLSRTALEQRWAAETASSAPVAVFHLLPAEGDALIPCCRRTPYELPTNARLTPDQSLVTCTGRYGRQTQGGDR